MDTNCGDCPHRRFDTCNYYDARLDIMYRGIYIINGHEYQCDRSLQEKIEQKAW